MKGVKENTWGGRRSGSGRKKSGKKYKTLSMCGTENELNEIKGKAVEAEKTVSRFIIETILSDNNAED